MSKKQNQLIQSQSPLQKQPSIGVGEHYADPQREIIEWIAVYFQGKFYLSDPYSIAKLQQIQSEIDLQKKMANEFRRTQQVRAESERSFNKNVETSGYSCATEKSPQKMRLNQLKAEKELYREEEAYMNKLIELKNRRKYLQNKKANKNLIAIKKDETKSVKQVIVKKKSLKREKIQRELPKIEHEVQIQLLNKNTQSEKVQLPKQSLVTINFNQLQPNLYNPVILQSPKANNSVANQRFKIIEQTNIKEKDLQIEQKQTQHLAHQSPRSKQESIIIRNIKPVPLSSNHQNIDILNMSSEAEKDINQQIANQRAGSSFFNQIHSQLYKLQHNINNFTKNPGQNKQKSEQIQQQDQQKAESVNREPIYRPGKLLQETDNILKQLQEGLQQIDQKDLEHSMIVKQTKITKQSIQNKKASKPQQKQKIIVEPQLAQVTIKSNKPKRLLFSSNIVNYHINESTRQNSDIHSQERQKLQKEINVLQQVINQLRVQRLKYQVSQNSRIIEQQPDRANSSNQLYIETRNLLRLAESPPPIIQDLSHFNATTPSPMVQSSVSQYHNASSLSKYKMARSKSGKIVKNLNMFSESEMPKIEEEFIGQTHNQQKIEQKQFIIRQQTEKQVSIHKKQRESEKNQQISEIKSVQNHEINIKQKSKTQKNIIEQYLHKPQIKQADFKIKTIQPYPKHSSAATQQNISSKPQMHVQKQNQTDFESSMPRTLIHRYNQSNPPKITPNQHPNNLKKRQKNINKQLLEQFQQIQKQPKYSTLQPQNLDPKRRASRQGILKNIEPKIPQNIALDKTSNLKRKICQIQQTKKPNEQPKEQEKSRNFRSRRESESVRNSRASFTNKSTKSVANDNRYKRQDQTVYVPALNPSVSHPLYPKENVIYQRKFDQADLILDPSNLDIKKRKIFFSNITIPVIPPAPALNITVENMVALIKQLGSALNMQFKDKDLNRMVMKKFKNCIMLDLPRESNNKLVWHYNQKVYLGGWHEAKMQKHGEGQEYIPDKYYYKGEFFNNKRQGNGIMLFFNDSIYQGEWSQGQKHGKGKYQDKSLGLYYQGEWQDGKRNGIGYLSVEGQSRYEGTFSSNYRTGHGAQKFSNNDYYKGEYQMGKFHGKGMYVWSSGSSYEGDFYLGLKQGNGKWRSGSGQLYIGQFFQDKKQGRGRFIWQNGCIYEGEFALDKKNGRGTLKYSDGRKVAGIWKNGQMIEAQQIKDQEGRQQPLAYRKGQNFQTVTILKTGEQRAKNFSISGRISNY